MQKITPFLWFDDDLEEAMEFYASIFPDSKIHGVQRYEVEQQGTVVTAEFELAGQRFMGLNGGPEFKFTNAVSFYVNCESQKEVDDYWEKLLAGGGQTQACGWLTDKFGLSWQIIPKQLIELMGDPDPEKAQRVMQAMLQMVKIDIAELERAHAGR